MTGKVSYAIPNGVPVPVGDSSGTKTVAHWLGNDIQFSKSEIARWRQTLTNVASGLVAPGYLGTGNAHSVYATKTHVLIESEYVESFKVYMTLEQVEQSLIAYLDFLESDFRNPSFEPAPFDVDFLSECDTARTDFLQSGGSLA